MTPPSHQDSAWQRLGELLIRRRVEINPSYAKRSTFCTDTGLDYRVVADIEKARRTNFSRAVIVQLEAGYQLSRGNIERILRGGDLEPAEPVAQVSGVRFEAPSAPHRQDSVIISGGGATQAITVDPSEPEPDPETILGPLNDQEVIVWALRNVRWQARVAAIEAMRAGIKVAQDANAARRRRTPRPKPSLPDIGQASSDG
jgi:hypothetical protein